MLIPYVHTPYTHFLSLSHTQRERERNAITFFLTRVFRVVIFLYLQVSIILILKSTLIKANNFYFSHFLIFHDFLRDTQAKWNLLLLNLGFNFHLMSKQRIYFILFIGVKKPSCNANFCSVTAKSLNSNTRTSNLKKKFYLKSLLGVMDTCVGGGVEVGCGWYACVHFSLQYESLTMIILKMILKSS